MYNYQKRNQTKDLLTHHEGPVSRNMKQRVSNNYVQTYNLKQIQKPVVQQVSNEVKQRSGFSPEKPEIRPRTSDTYKSREQPFDAPAENSKLAAPKNPNNPTYKSSILHNEQSFERPPQDYLFTKKIRSSPPKSQEYKYGLVKQVDAVQDHQASDIFGFYEKQGESLKERMARVNKQQINEKYEKRITQQDSPYVKQYKELNPNSDNIPQNNSLNQTNNSGSKQAQNARDMKHSNLQSSVFEKETGPHVVQDHNRDITVISVNQNANPNFQKDCIAYDQYWWNSNGNVNNRDPRLNAYNRKQLDMKSEIFSQAPGPENPSSILDSRAVLNPEKNSITLSQEDRHNHPQTLDKSVVLPVPANDNELSLNFKHSAELDHKEKAGRFQKDRFSEIVMDGKNSDNRQKNHNYSDLFDRLSSVASEYQQPRSPPKNNQNAERLYPVNIHHGMIDSNIYKNDLNFYHDQSNYQQSLIRPSTAAIQSQAGSVSDITSLQNFAADKYFANMKSALDTHDYQAEYYKGRYLQPPGPNDALDRNKETKHTMSQLLTPDLPVSVPNPEDNPKSQQARRPPLKEVDVYEFDVKGVNEQFDAQKFQKFCAVRGYHVVDVQNDYNQVNNKLTGRGQIILRNARKNPQGYEVIQGHLKAQGVQVTSETQARRNLNAGDFRLSADHGDNPQNNPSNLFQKNDKEKFVVPEQQSTKEIMESNNWQNKIQKQDQPQKFEKLIRPKSALVQHTLKKAQEIQEREATKENKQVDLNQQ